jgi:enoyl-[acyl-carrier protein] reductase III
MNLKNKYSLVTGGSRGIGRAIALELAERGADVAINFFSNRANAESTRKEIEGLGVKALAVRANVGNPDHISRMFRAVKEEFGALDILVSNAASGALKSTLELDIKDWERSMDINARALLLMAQHAVPLMEGRRGKIVSITSMGSTRYIPSYGAVGASKAALETVTRYLAMELGRKHINVNAVAAGVIDTDSLKMFPNREDLLEDAKSFTPKGRLAEPSDIARVVAMLCSEDADWVCGQVIVADGGHSLHA